METNTRDIELNRIKGTVVTLANQGLSYKKIAAQITRTGFRTLKNKKPSISYISYLLYRARKEGFVPGVNTVTTPRRVRRTTEELLQNITLPRGLAPATGMELAKRELSRTIISTSVFSDEFKTNVVEAIFRN